MFAGKIYLLVLVAVVSFFFVRFGGDCHVTISLSICSRSYLVRSKPIKITGVRCSVAMVSNVAGLTPMWAAASLRLNQRGLIYTLISMVLSYAFFAASEIACSITCSIMA